MSFCLAVGDIVGTIIGITVAVVLLVLIRYNHRRGSENRISETVVQYYLALVYLVNQKPKHQNNGTK